MNSDMDVDGMEETSLLSKLSKISLNVILGKKVNSVEI
jgi:hypothetical protein